VHAIEKPVKKKSLCKYRLLYDHHQVSDVDLKARYPCKLFLMIPTLPTLFDATASFLSDISNV